MFYSDRLFIRKMFLLAGDFGLMFFSLFLSLSVRQLRIVTPEFYQLNLSVFWPIFLFSAVIYFLFDLYNIRVLESIYRSVYYLFLAVVTNLLLATAFLYVFYQQESGVTPKTVLILYGSLLFLLTMAWRFLYHDLFLTNIRYQSRIIIIGGDGGNADLFKIVQASPSADFQIIGYLSEDEGRKASPFPAIRFLGSFKDIRRVIREEKAGELILGFDYKKDGEFIRELSDSLTLGVRIYEWQTFFEQIFQKVPTNRIDHFWFLYNFGESDKKLYERLKRLADVAISLFGIIFLGIVLPPVALLIKLTSRGPVFYKQQRMGFDGNLFTLIKFRTMGEDAEKDGAVWAKKGDKRVTPVGKFLRKTRIDELPQFWNILRGEMSLVGPRPERPEFLPILSEKIPFYYKRHMVKPGVTGFAQVMYPYAESVEDSLEKVGYDLFYIKNRSFYLYTKIILLTVRTMLAFRGQ